MSTYLHTLSIDVINYLANYVCDKCANYNTKVEYIDAYDIYKPNIKISISDRNITQLSIIYVGTYEKEDEEFKDKIGVEDFVVNIFPAERSDDIYRFAYVHKEDKLIISFFDELFYVETNDFGTQIILKYSEHADKFRLYFEHCKEFRY